MEIKIEDFGYLSDGKIVKKFVLTNENKLSVVLMNYGASLISLFCPDRHGSFDDILLGFDTLEGYINNPYFGSTIGRVANRICHGKFDLDGVSYQLNCSDGNNHLHGGNIGFDKKLWSWSVNDNGMQFELRSEDGDENYPGTLNVSVVYKLTANNKLKIIYKATTDKASLINLTNHAFINLTGQNKASNVMEHELEIHSNSYLPHVDGIPTGEIKHVDKTFDFNSPKCVGCDINDVSGGYDHNYCLHKENTFCARLYDKQTGRELEIETSQPGVQFYTGNFLNNVGKNGNIYKPQSGLCLEPQNYPDSVNQPSFPSSILRPGEVYEQFITWKINTRS